MDKEGEKLRLIGDLWRGDFVSAAGQFTRANPGLTSFFHEQLLDGKNGGRMNELRTQPRFESVLAALFKARSKNLVTLEAAAMSIQLLHFRTPDVVWQTITHFTRNVMSATWASS